MINKLQLGVRTWLLGLVAFASAPILLFAAYSINQLELAERASETQRLILSGQASAHAVAQRLNVSLGFIKAIAATNAAKQGDLPALYDYASKAIRLNQDSKAISLVDRQERLVFLTLRPFGTDGLPVGDLDSVRKVFQTGKPSISIPFKSPLSDAMVVAIGVPVFSADEVAYCLRLILPVKVLSVMLEEQKLAEGWISAVIGDGEILLARSKSSEIYVGQRASPTLLAALSKPPGGVFESMTLDGVPALTTVAQVPDWNLKVVVGVPLQILAGDSTKALYNLLAFGLLVGIGSAILAIWISRFIAARINFVVAASSAQHRGERHEVPPTGIREVDHALSQMSSVTDREQHVKQSLADLTLQNQQVQHALKSARKDGLTQLPGRAEFLGLVEELHQNVSIAGNSQLVILFLDLDGFKGINDLHGHVTGDAVLKKTADVLRDQTRGADIVGRFGGDEFVICLHAEAGRFEQIAIDVASRIVEKVAAIGYGVGCSVGIAVWTSACPDLDSVMRRADEAMYEAKRRGKNQFVFSN